MKSKGETGIVKTIPKRDIVELNTQITAQRLMQNGIDPMSLKNADQVENAIIAIESRPKVQEGIQSTKSAKIMDMEGKEIDPRSKIMGGKQSETEAEIAERLSRENKEATRNLQIKLSKDKGYQKFKGETEEEIRKRFGLDDPEDMAQGGRAGFKEGEGIIKMAGSLGDEKDEISREIFGKPVKDLNPDELQELMEELERLREKFRAAQGGRAGFFMGSANPRGLGLLRQLLNFFGKKSDVIRNPSDTLKIVNPKAFNKMLEDAKGKMIPKEGIMATDKIKDYQTEMARDRIEMVKDMIERGKRMKGADDKILAYQNDVKQRFMKDLNMSEADAEKAAERMATLAADITKMEKTPKITEEGILQLENVLKNMETGGKKARDLNADGGRIGFKDGMTRRTFLKIFGGLVSLPIVGKVLAPLKLTKGVSKVPIIKTDNVPGKPEWFDALVNKVIIEGDDVTKKFATGERQSIHQKTLDDGSVVRVTEDVDDGAVRVEYESVDNMYKDPVQLQYKKPLPDEGDPNPAAQFDVAESGPVGRSAGPDDFDIDIEEVGGTSISDLSSDVSKLKQYATGKGPTMKEIVEIKKRKDKVKAITSDSAAEAEEVVRRQGDYVPEPDDFASGGIARMLGE